MASYLLIVTLNGFIVKHPYNFFYKETCEKVGKQIASIKKTWSYKCVKKV